MTEVYAGLDISDKETHICLVDRDGCVVWRGRCVTDPETIAKTLARRGAVLERAVLEAGPLSAFLYHGLLTRGVPVVCVCARHAKGVLSRRINKTDPNDAEGLAQLSRTGWYKAVHMKEAETHLERASLKVRERLTRAHRDMSNQLRGLLKLFGLRLGMVTTPNKRAERLEALFDREPALRSVLAPLVAMLEALERQLKLLDKQLSRRAAADPVCRRLMTAPGVGPLTALTFKTAVEDPARFGRSSDLGAYAGLTPRRYQSGERDVAGHIAKTGDKALRHALYEAANSLLSRLKRDCALKSWGLTLVETRGPKRARVAVARKLAILLHRLWKDETEFQWA